MSSAYKYSEVNTMAHVSSDLIHAFSLHVKSVHVYIHAWLAIVHFIDVIKTVVVRCASSQKWIILKRIRWRKQQDKLHSGI